MAVILAAGKGTRMKSALPKVLHPISGLSMVEHVVRAVNQCQVEDIVTIIGNEAERVKETLVDQCHFAMQEDQLGTGHAVAQARTQIGDADGQTLVICGDTPLLRGETLAELFRVHDDQQAKATILTAVMPDPTGYGRVIRDQEGAVQKIVEQKDASEKEAQVQEINTGTYVFDNRLLFKALEQVNNDNQQGEYYLTDVIQIIRDQGGLVCAHQMPDRDEGMGVNDRQALASAQKLMSDRINAYHMQNGVTFTDPESVYIEVDVQIGPDSLIETGVQLKGQTVIGSGAMIGAQTQIVDSQLADHVTVKQSVIESSIIGPRASIGPYAHLRPKAYLAEDVHIGNFVEVKNASIGARSKAGHLAYIGDADLGQEVNVGCGVIFCNYDGKEKHRSKVGDQVFIGSNANIVSPITIEDRAFIAAGSTIVSDVEAEALAIARSQQVQKADYWKKFLNK